MKTAVQTLRSRAYVRVSHVGKSRQTTLLSDAMQLDEARRYAAYQGFHFDEQNSKLNADLDVSGFKKPWRQRPGLMQHYEAAKRGEFDVLIFYKISRLGRNTREGLDMIDAFEKLGVAFHFVADRVDSSNAQGRFVRNVLLSASEMQSEDASAFLKSTFERRAREGKLHGGALPGWLRRLPDRSVETIPDQVAAVRRMITLRLEGNGYVHLAEKMNREGLRTARGRYWTHGTTFKYLQPTYIQSMLGTAFYGRWTAEAVAIPGAFPAIITPEEAERLIAVQKLYSEEYTRKPTGGIDWMLNRQRKRGRYSASSIHILSSIIFCPYCSARMIAIGRTDHEIQHRSTPFSYRCPNSVTRAELHTRSLNRVNAGSLEDAVLRVLRGELVMPPEPIEDRPAPLPTRDSILDLQTKIDRVVTMHLDRKLEDDDFKRAYSALVIEKEHLMEVAKESGEAEQRKQLTELAARDDLSREELRQLVLLLVERVEAPIVIPDVTIREDRLTLRRLAKVTLRFPLLSAATEFYAPIYLSCYRGAKTYVPIESNMNARSLVVPAHHLRDFDATRKR